MAHLHIMLGGVPIVTHAGAPEQSEAPIGGSSLLRMSGGKAVKQQHWQCQSGTVSGNGLMPPGLDGLDYSLPLELRLTEVSNMVGEGPAFVLTSTPRPDKAPWAFYQLDDGRWQRCACSFTDGVVAVPPVPGAVRYQVAWMPVYSVFTDKPSKTQSTSHGWSFSWEEA